MKKFFRVSIIAAVFMLFVQVIFPKSVQADISSQTSLPTDLIEAQYQRLAEQAVNGPVPVIIGLRVQQGEADASLSVQSSQANALIVSQAQEKVLDQLTGFQIASIKRFEHIPYMALQVDASGLAALRASPDVISIEEDRLAEPALETSVGLIGARFDQNGGFNGYGQTIALLDTGVEKNHPFLANKVVAEACYSTTYASQNASSVCPPLTFDTIGAGVPCTVNGCEHGTLIAGTVAGKMYPGGPIFSGVAPDAKIISIQIYSKFTTVDKCGGPAPCIRSYQSDLIAGLNRVFTLSSQFHIAAVNISLGGSGYTTSESCDADNPSLKAAIDKLLSVNIPTIVSSGNSGLTDNMGWPACISSAVSVGSTRDGGAGADPVDTVSDFSTSAPFLDLLAPGEAIESSLPGGLYEVRSGTSLAAAHVSGAMALLKSKNRDLNPNQALSLFTSTGVPITDPRNNVVTPRLQVDAAMQQVSRATPPVISSFSPTSGLPGSVVSLQGTNLYEISSLALNGVPAQFTLISDTSMQVIVPHGASSGIFQGTTQLGSVSAPGGFTVLTPDLQFTKLEGGIEPFSKSAAAWGDYDNDGDLDLLISGMREGLAATAIYRNDSSKFTDVRANTTPLYSGSVSWGDYDQDGDLDFVATGYQRLTNDTTYPRAEIYRNDGGDLFTKINAQLIGVFESATAWGDYDNDGDLDLALMGSTGVSYGQTILKIYRNNGGSNFSIGYAFSKGFKRGSLDWGDYDNDGILDLAVMGQEQPNANLIYRNTGTGSFTTLTLGSSANYGENDWADFDNDGDLDLLVVGEYLDYYTGHVSNVYQNKGGTGGFNTITLPVRFTHSSAVWGDFDSDGDSDIIITGKTSTGSQSSNQAGIYRNNGNASFTLLSAPLTPITDGAAIPGDIDNDGDLDVLFTGSVGASGFTALYRNDIVQPLNQPPAAPGNLTAAIQPADGNVALSWSASTDDHTPSAGLTYQLRVGTVPGGQDVIPAMSDLETGLRRMPAMGSEQSGTSSKVSGLKLGSYYWSVQAVDASHLGSPFAVEGQIKVVPRVTFPTQTSSVSEEVGHYSATVSLSEPAAEAGSVAYAVVAETASPGVDFEIVQGRLNFAAGDSSLAIELPILEDELIEDAETLVLKLSAPENLILGINTQQTLTIRDNDGFIDSGVVFPTGYGFRRAWGDYDNDGDLDVVINGVEGAEYTYAEYTHLLRNDGGGQFSKMPLVLPPMHWGYLAWVDFDNDGDLDLHQQGDSLIYSSDMFSSLFINEGNSTFTTLDLYKQGIYGREPNWSDLDNDGDLDLVQSWNSETYIYSNNGNRTFTRIQVSMTGGESIALGDYDNDGDLDLAQSGKPYLYRNEGSWRFTDVSHLLPPINNGSSGKDLNWGDYDNDSDLDLLITGSIQESNGSIKSSTAGIYRNLGNGSFTFISLWPSYSPDEASWGDYDNDGDLDIFLSGFTGYSITNGHVYRNDGDHFTNIQARIGFGQAGPTAWGDYDNDGRLDLLTKGKIYRNMTNGENSPPSAPTNLTAEVQGRSVLLRWDAGSDLQTPAAGLTYQLRLGDYPGGQNVIGAGIDLRSGRRLTPSFGQSGVSRIARVDNLIAGRTYYWSVQAIDGALAGSPFAQEGSFTIPMPTIQFAQDKFHAVEADGSTMITVSLSRPADREISIDYSTADGTALDGSDYLKASGTLTFPLGVQTQSFTIPILADDEIEADESVLLSLSNAQGIALDEPQEAALFIVDAATLPLVQFASNTFPVKENDTKAYLTVQLSKPFSLAVSVNWEIGEQYDHNPDGYRWATGRLTFAPGETERVIEATLVDDTVYDGNKNVALTLSHPVFARLGENASATMIIQDNEEPPVIQMTAGGYSISEAAGSTGTNVNILVKYTGVAKYSVYVYYRFIDESTGGVSDFNNKSGVIYFPSYAQEYIRIPIYEDALDEEDETFLVELYDPVNGQIGPIGSARVTIFDNDPQPLVGFTSTSLSVGEGEGTAKATLKLSAPSGRTVSVWIKPVGDTAHPDKDFQAVSQLVTFAPGETEKEVRIAILDDRVQEENETLSLIFENLANTGVGSQASIQINVIDNDPLVSVFLPLVIEGP